MDINSQHHNLLGNQILPKSEDLVGFKMNKNRGDIEKNEFLSSNFMKICRNIHLRVAAFGGLNKFKMAPFPWQRQAF
jgi:hypothetical protein